MSTQQLKALAQKCLSKQAGVDQNAAYANFIAHVEPQEIVTLFERLDAAERERDGAMSSALAVADAWVRRAKAAEAELARRDAAAGEQS